MSLKFHRLNNRFLYFLSFQLPLTSSYSNRALVNYFSIFINMDTSKEEKKNFSKTNDIKLSESLLINNIFKLYLDS
jgi:hypothetical protein